MNSLLVGAAELTVDLAVRERALLHPSRPALVQDGVARSFGALQTRVDALCHALLALGVGRHDRVAVLSENRVEYIEIMLAAAALGAIVACQNWRQSDGELAHCIAMVEPTLVIASERHAERAERAAQAGARPSNALLFGDAYESMIARYLARGTLQSRAQPEDILFVLYTSGTTGFPKGAMISHRAEIARAVIGTLDGQLYTGMGTICWSPLYHIGGCDQTLGALMNGDTVFVVDGFQPPVLVDILSRELIGNVNLMPASIGRLIEEVERTGLRPKGLRSCGTMADLVPRHQIAEITTLLNAEFRNTFGATETGQPPASRHRIPIGVIPERLSKTQSSYTRLRLVDENDIDVPLGSPGEVLFRGPSLFSGYWNAPDVNREDFRGGWFHMGDMMRRNSDGSLDFVDRRKYLIKSGGENIYPAEIERLLLGDRRVRDAAVVRKPDAHWGEVPVAFVVRADETLTAADVVAICRGHVANYKLPKEVYFLADADMPRSETSKIKRFELEAMLRSPKLPAG